MALIEQRQQKNNRSKYLKMNSEKKNISITKKQMNIYTTEEKKQTSDLRATTATRTNYLKVTTELKKSRRCMQHQI